jgi:hypothetical protein
MKVIHAPIPSKGKWIKEKGYSMVIPAFRKQIFHLAETTGQLVLLFLEPEEYPYVLSLHVFK